ncbi:unnamed protein product, partial [Natator depressus]
MFSPSVISESHIWINSTKRLAQMLFTETIPKCTRCSIAGLRYLQYNNLDLRSWGTQRVKVKKKQKKTEISFVCIIFLNICISSAEASIIAWTRKLTKRLQVDLIYPSTSQAAAVEALRGAPSIPKECLTPMRRRKKLTREDACIEVLQSSAVLDCEQRAWRVNIEGSLEKGKSRQEKGTGVPV